jgi:hypothetical protein
MITLDYIRTMAEYNAEMNRRLYGAAARLSDPERRQPRGAFWGSIKADAGVSRAGLTRSTAHGSPRTSPGSAGLPIARSAHRCGCW